MILAQGKRLIPASLVRPSLQIQNRMVHQWWKNTHMPYCPCLKHLNRNLAALHRVPVQGKGQYTAAMCWENVNCVFKSNRSLECIISTVTFPLCVLQSLRCIWRNSQKQISQQPTDFIWQLLYIAIFSDPLVCCTRGPCRSANRDCGRSFHHFNIILEEVKVSDTS